MSEIQGQFANFSKIDSTTFSNFISNGPVGGPDDGANVAAVKGYYLRHINFDDLFNWASLNYATDSILNSVIKCDNELEYDEYIAKNLASQITITIWVDDVSRSGVELTNNYIANPPKTDGVSCAFIAGNDEWLTFRMNNNFPHAATIKSVSGNKLVLTNLNWALFKFFIYNLAHSELRSPFGAGQWAPWASSGGDHGSVKSEKHPSIGAKIISSQGSISSGWGCKNIGAYSHTFGNECTATGKYSAAIGNGVIAGSYSQFVCGWDGIPDYEDTYKFILAGAYRNNNANALTVDYHSTICFDNNSYFPAKFQCFAPPVRVSEGNKKCLIAGNLNSIIVRSGADNNLICGENNQVAGSNQIVTGQYSLPDASGALIIGNGTEERDRKNSLVIKKDGTIVVPVYDSTGTNQTGEFAVLKVVKASNGSLSIKAFKN